jgi:hypothetical protein
MSRNRSLWTLGAVLPIIITLYTDTIHPKAMRRELLLLALLFSSLGLVGQAPSPRLLLRTIRRPGRHNPPLSRHLGRAELVINAVS